MKPKPKNGATAVALAAGCSKGLASRLLGRGFTPEQIRLRVQERKARELARLAQINGSAPVDGIPVVPWPSFAASEARKEHLLAELRDLELMRERGELIPTRYVELWGSKFLVAAKDELLKAPGELQDILANEEDPRKVNAILRAWIERVIAKLCGLERLWNPPLPGPEAA